MHRAKLEKAWKKNTQVLRNVASIGDNVQQLGQAIIQIKSNHSCYQELSETHITYLTRANTGESLQERDIQSNIGAELGSSTARELRAAPV
ncbi:hypothetical protein FKM82_025879 [Ascaphus truei]